MAGALNTGQGTLRPAYITNYGEAMTPGANNAAVNVFLQPAPINNLYGPEMENIMR